MRLIVFAMAVFLVAAACSDSDGSTDGGSSSSTPTEPTPTSAVTTAASTADFEELTAARQRWATAGDADYDYVFTTSCECPAEISEPNLVKVRNGDVVRVSHEGQIVDREARTIEQYFSSIEAAIAQGVEIDVRYDDVTGRPIKVWLDTEAMAVDGGDGTDIVEFTSQAVFRVELERARDLWVSSAIGNYEVTHMRLCFCPEETRIVTVENGSFASMTTPEALAPEFHGPPLTVHEMFSELAEAFDAGAASIVVEYHPELGYPTDYFIDEIENMADEEHGLTVLSLERTV